MKKPAPPPAPPKHRDPSTALTPITAWNFGCVPGLDQVAEDTEVLAELLCAALVRPSAQCQSVPA